MEASRLAWREWGGQALPVLRTHPEAGFQYMLSSHPAPPAREKGAHVSSISQTRRGRQGSAWGGIGT